MIKYLVIEGSKVLSNTSFNITATVDMSSWTEGNYTTTCRARDI
jgi:hypothetical protein